MPTVKGATRASRTLATRRRMQSAAHDLFVEQGYAATTMDQIATRAGVAVQTVYYTFRSKGRLLCEVVDVVAAGGDVTPVMEREWAREMLAASSAQRVLALGVEHGTAIYERVSDLWPSLGAAASVDPDVAAYWRTIGAGRRDGQGRMVARVEELEGLRYGLDAVHATDLTVVLFGHEVYRGLVIDSGWSPGAYRAWLFTTLAQQLLASEPDPQAVGDLSYAGYLGGSDRA